MKLYLYDADDDLVFEGTKAACRNFIQKNPGDYTTEYKRKQVREKAVVEEDVDFGKVVYNWSDSDE